MADLVLQHGGEIYKVGDLVTVTYGAEHTLSDPDGKNRKTLTGRIVSISSRGVKLDCSKRFEAITQIVKIAEIASVKKACREDGKETKDGVLSEILS